MTTASRYIVAAAVGAIYTVAIALLVGVEGRSYRESLREARGRRPEIVATIPTPAPAPAPAPPSPPPPVVVSVPVPPATVQPTPATAPAPAPTPPTPATAPAPAISVAANNVPAPKPPAIPKKAEAPVERTPEMIWADSLERLDAITVEQERRLGADLDQRVRETNLEDTDGDVERLRRAAEPMLRGVSRPEIAYKFVVLNSTEVNAFSLPGGFVYVSSGLFNLVGKEVEPEDDYALQFVLGHEIAHVDLRHMLKVVAPGNDAAKKQGVDTLSHCMLPIALGYPDPMEFEADAWAYGRLTRQVGHTHREASMFLTQYKGYSKKYGFPNGRMMPDPKSGLNLVENHFRAHPAAWDRLARLKPTATQTPEAAPMPR